MPHARTKFAALLLASAVAIAGASATAAEPTAPADAAKSDNAKLLAPYFAPPAEFAGDLGPYRSPLLFDDGKPVASAADWPRRRAEILAKWRTIIGPLPEPLAAPKVEVLEERRRENFRERHVHIEVGPQGRMVDGYLLVPDGPGPFPAVLTPFYEPQTSIGLGKPDTLGAIDFGLQLTRRGFVTLAIGTPGSLEKPKADVRELLVSVADELQAQPLGYLALVATNCRIALGQMPNVDKTRIGMVGHSYGGKWTMFSTCLDDQFACACWCDPGIVFNEINRNVNYWEPWYIGWAPGTKRKPGVPAADNPRTGPYKTLYEHESREMVELHALIAGRPVLLSGGSEDPAENWRALNHLIAVNKLLGRDQLVAMTSRPMHRPTPEAAAVIYAFFEHWLKR